MTGSLYHFSNILQKSLSTLIQNKHRKNKPPNVAANVHNHGDKCKSFLKLTNIYEDFF